jgi:hypothetical protein
VKKKPQSKAPRAKGAGRGNNVPPAEHRFKEGPDDRRCKGGDTARAILQNCINGLYRKNLRTISLTRIATDPEKPEWMRQAAQIILHSRRGTTLADFEDWIEGKKTLKQLAKSGVDVAMVKAATVTHHNSAAKQKILRILKNAEVESAVIAEVATLLSEDRVRRAIELFADRGENFDRIMNHTGISPGEQEKYARIDMGQGTEVFQAIEIVVPGLTAPPPPKNPAKQ